MPGTLQGKVEPPPWDEIRRLYETTPIGIPSLARKYGFSSKTTINRRKAKEGWAKQVDELISVSAAELIVADIRRTQEAQAPDPDPGPDPAVMQAIQEMRVYDPVLKPESATAHASAQADEAEYVRAADVGQSGMVPSVDDLEDRRDAVVAQMAGIHAERIRTQLAHAGELQQVGTGILRLIMAATTPATDQVTLARRQHAVASLCGVNPDRETMAGLLKAASDVLSKAISLERLVLGIGPQERTKVGAVVITNPAPASADPSSPGRVLKGLDTQSAWKLREVLAEASRAARRRQTGQMEAQHAIPRGEVQRDVLSG